MRTRTSRFPLLTIGLALATGAAASAAPLESVHIVPDVVCGHKAGMALTFDLIKPRENPSGAAVMFMVSGGWFSRCHPPEKIYED